MTLPKINFPRGYVFPLIILVMAVVLSLINWVPGTWLTGWDNLHPEFDFGLNLKRSIFSVWEEYQGLGVLAGMGHAADLPRQLFLWIISLVLPINTLRYFYTFLMLVLGSLGAYFLAIKIAKNKIAAFGAGLFYLLNLATVQIFYTPYEAFITHYGFLPWLLLVFIAYLEKPDRRNMFWLALVNLLAVPQGYVPTVFIVYFLTILLIGLVNRGKRLAAAIAIVLAVNAFWLLPFGYYTLTNTESQTGSHLNFMVSDDMYARNNKFGDLLSVVRLKSFWFDYVEINPSGTQTGYLVGGWRDFVDLPPVRAIGYLSFALVLSGLAFSWYKKLPYRLAFSIIFLVCITVLASNTFPFSFIDQAWRHIPMVKEVFRNPFTKFGNLTLLSYSLFFSFGIVAIAGLAKSHKKVINTVIIIVIPILLIVYTWPAWQGKLIEDKLRIKIPGEYFQLFDFFRKQDPDSRIANLPQASYIAWTYYIWGGHGSGFLWYGIRQPVLDRAFDVWGKTNEQYYWELSQALSARDLISVEKVLKKYQIRWIILDENVRSRFDYQALGLPQTEQLFRESGKISLAATFNQIKVYAVNLNTKNNSYVQLINNPAVVKSDNVWLGVDSAFIKLGNYIEKPMGITFPFRSLFSGRGENPLGFIIEDQGDKYVFKAQLAPESTGQQLNVPLPSLREFTYWDNNLNRYLLLPEIYIDNRQVFAGGSVADQNLLPEASGDLIQSSASATFQIPPASGGILSVLISKEKGYYSFDSGDSVKNLNQTAKSCDPFNDGVKKLETVTVDGNQMLRLTSQGSGNCLDYSLPQLSHQIGYLVSFSSRNIEGRELLFEAVNMSSKRNEIETYLFRSNGEIKNNYFIIPPTESDGQGYTLHFDNISIGGDKTVNELGRIQVYQVPYQMLSGISVSNQNSGLNAASAPFRPVLTVDHPNTGLYRVTITGPSDENEILSLSQSFNPGWIALRVENNRPVILKHISVNNWENGWELNNYDIKSLNRFIIYIFYWPQILEYIGAAAGLVCFSTMINKRLIKHKITE